MVKEQIHTEVLRMEFFAIDLHILGWSLLVRHTGEVGGRRVTISVLFLPPLPEPVLDSAKQLRVAHRLPPNFRGEFF